MSNQTFLNYGRHFVDEDDVAAVVAVLRGDLLTQGPMVNRFEEACAERVGARYAVAVANGTAALHLAALAAGLEMGDRGATSAISFVASANCMSYTGADADLVDIDPQHLGMAPSALHAYLQAQPSCQLVIPVLFGGLAEDSADVKGIAGNRVIIEDACHAFGGFYADGMPVGSCAHSTMTVFSFHPVKPITTGEGGIITTNDPELARRLRLLRTHGIEKSPEAFLYPDEATDGEGVHPWYYEQQALGYNYRLTDIQAALGLSQLAKIDAFIARRREIAMAYDAAFAKLECVRLLQADPAQRKRSAHHLYVLSIDFAALGLSRRQFMAKLAGYRVGSQVHYIPIYRQPYHRQRLGDVRANFPQAEAYYSGALSLPLYQGMTDEDVTRVIEAVRNCVGDCPK